MCELASASLALTALSTLGGIAGQAQQASSQQAMYGYQATVARNNQIAAERLAQDAEKRGAAAEQERRTRTSSVMGSQVARLAAQGTDLAGSPADLLGDTAAAGELEALKVRNAAAREAQDWRNKGVQAGADAEVASWRQANAGPSALGIGTSLLAGAGSFADKWYQFDKQGAFGRKTVPMSGSPIAPYGP